MKIKFSFKKTIFILLLIIFLYIAFYPGLTVKYYTLKTNKISEAIKIVLITDLHSCFYGKEQIRLINKINEQKPDIILMAGDIADDVLPHDGTISMLKGLTPKYPCYYVSGNHEFWSGEIDSIKMMLEAYGVKVLSGSNETILLNNQMINICGVDDPDVSAPVFNNQLENALPTTPSEYYTILLSHRPELFEKYISLNCDLILSGHAHGGQWRIPFILNGLFAPNQGFFPKYAGGVYIENGRTMIVSRGLALESTGIPRIFNPPELVVIELLPE